MPFVFLRLTCSGFKVQHPSYGIDYAGHQLIQGIVSAYHIIVIVASALL